MASTDDPAVRPEPAPDGSLNPPEGGEPQTERSPQRPGSGNPQNGLKVGGWIMVGLGGLFVVAAIAAVVVHLTQRDKDGYYTSSTVQVAAPGYAITAEGLHIANLPSVTGDVIGTLRVSAKSNNGRPVFVGIAPQSAVNGYLGAVARNQVTDVNGGSVSYKTHPGSAPAGPPARQAFWYATSSGTGQVTDTWKVKGGDWTIVLMNASGAPNVSAAVILGAKTNLVLW